MSWQAQPSCDLHGAFEPQGMERFALQLGLRLHPRAEPEGRIQKSPREGFRGLGRSVFHDFSAQLS